MELCEAAYSVYVSIQFGYSEDVICMATVLKLGLCYPSNLVLEYSASTLASTRVLAYSI